MADKACAILPTSIFSRICKNSSAQSGCCHLGSDKSSYAKLIYCYKLKGSGCGWVVVVAQLVEQSLPTPEIRSSKTRHWQNFIYQLFNRKDKNKEKEAGNGPFKKLL